MPIYELINPSDPYTFEAPDLTVAGVAVALLSTQFGARRVDVEEDETTPILFGWPEWLEDRGIDDAWVESHRAQLADAWDSFLIGSYDKRQDVQDMLAMLPPDKQQEWRDRRQDRHRSSLNQIGERAYELARRFRALIETEGA